jgi:hypothetical protein
LAGLAADPRCDITFNPLNLNSIQVNIIIPKISDNFSNNNGSNTLTYHAHIEDGAGNLKILYGLYPNYSLLTSFKINTNIILSKIYKFSYRIGNIFGYSNSSTYYTASQSSKIPSPLIFVSGNNNNTINIKIPHGGGIKKIMIFRDYGNQNINTPIFSLIYEDIYTNSIIIKKNEIH